MRGLTVDLLPLEMFLACLSPAMSASDASGSDKIDLGPLEDFGAYFLRRSPISRAEVTFAWEFADGSSSVRMNVLSIFPSSAWRVAGSRSDSKFGLSRSAKLSGGEAGGETRKSTSEGGRKYSERSGSGGFFCLCVLTFFEGIFGSPFLGWVVSFLGLL